VADAVPVLRLMNLGVKAMKETAKELDLILDEWLVEHRKKLLRYILNCFEHFIL